MKGVNYSVDIILLECKRIKDVFAENTEIAESIISRFMLTPPASIYTKTAGTAISSVYNSQDFANEQAEVGA